MEHRRHGTKIALIVGLQRSIRAVDEKREASAKQ